MGGKKWENAIVTSASEMVQSGSFLFSSKLCTWMLAHAPWLPPRPERCPCSVIAGASCVWILRVMCPKSFEKQLGSSVNPSISTEKGDPSATLGSPEHCTLPLPLHRLEPQAVQTLLQEAQVTPGLPGFFCGDLRSPLVPSNAAAKHLVCFWASQDDKITTFSKQLSKLQTPRCTGQAGVSAMRAAQSP